MSDNISIILVNYNQASFTIDCINSILSSSISNIRIIIIENSTNLECQNELDIFVGTNTSGKLTLIKSEKNLGYVGGINLGLAQAKNTDASYVLIMNNDTLIDRDAIISLLNVCRSFKDKAIVTGKVYHFENPNLLQQIGFKLIRRKQLIYRTVGLDELDKGQYEEQMEMDLLDDVFWLFSINLYNEIGGYNAYFWFNSEQADFALRAAENGYKLVYTPNAKIWHKGSASLGGRHNNPKLTYWHIQSTLIFHFLHQSKLNFLIFYLSILKSALTKFLILVISFSFKKDKWLNFKARAKAIMYFNKWLFVRNENIGKNPF